MNKFVRKNGLMEHCAYGAVAIAMISTPAAAQQDDEIRNTATLIYNNNSIQMTIQSNTVVTKIETPDVVPTIQFFVEDNNNPTTSMLINQSCGTAESGIINLAPATAAAAGVPVYVVVTDSSQNKDANKIETITANVGQDGSLKRVTLTETGVNTGVFTTGLQTYAAGNNAPSCSIAISGQGGFSGTYGNIITNVDISPYNVVFDSVTREIVKNGTVSIIDADTNQLATVYGIDGKATFPAKVQIGQEYKDSEGRSYAAVPGSYIFPMLPAGNYRILVEPSDGYEFPSKSTPNDFSDAPIINGKKINVIADASYGNVFNVPTLHSIDVDIPVDPVDAGFVVTKSVSATVATPGDYLQYTVTVQNNSDTGSAPRITMTDIMPKGLRYQAGSLKIDGVKFGSPSIGENGSNLTAVLPELAPGKSYDITYVALVTSNAAIGEAVNTVSVRAGGISSNTARVGVQVTGGLFSNAATIIGRVVSNSCLATDKDALPVMNARVLLEDGTYVLTDENGQYHIENVRPGLHVAQLDRNSLPEGYVFADCNDNTRRAGSNFSQFVDVRGGALWRADFYIKRADGAPEAANDITSTLTAPTEDLEAAPNDPVDMSDDEMSALQAGGNTNWIEQANGQNEILFPNVGHNPRSPSQRVVVAHKATDTVTVTVNGKEAPALNRDPSVSSPDGTAAVDIWSALELKEGNNLIEAKITAEDGSITSLERTVSYVNTAYKAVFKPELSKLSADGRENPIIAVRLLDRNGNPVRKGVSGRLDISAPYLAANAVQDRRSSQLISDQINAQSTWSVSDDNGVAYIALAPTTQTGEVRLNLHLQEGSSSLNGQVNTNSILSQANDVRAWLSPGEQDWVVVGFAAGSAGYTTLARQAESLSQNPGDLDEIDGQVKLYAKGRIKGRWLLTLAYDSDKQSDTQRRQSILTTVDPEAYYTLYGDNAQQSYDAQSTENLFIKLETNQFYALFGDFATAIDDTELGSYQRILTGVKSEYRSQKTAITAFVAKTPFRYAREEIQGQGLSGPYQLQRRDIVLNTETITVETRDRIRPDIIKDTRVLTRFIDYTVDYSRGTITLRYPLASRDFDLDPTFLVIEYETYKSSDDRLVAGVRGTQQINSNLKVGGTAYQNDDDDRTRMGTVDATAKIANNTYVRGEYGYSKGNTKEGSAFIGEIQHQSGKVDARAYVRQQDRDYGVGQTNGLNSGYRTLGIDTVYRFNDKLDLAISGQQIDDLASIARRRSAEIQTRYRFDEKTTVGADLRAVSERDAAGLRNLITQAQGNITRSFFKNKLLVTGESAFTLSGDPSVSTPTRHRIGASYAITSNVRAIVDHEIATARGVTGANTRIGTEITPWNGGTITGSYNQQGIDENGERTFGALGLRQTIPISEKWSADFGIDSTRTLSGKLSPDLVNPMNPPAIGGRISNTLVDDDFTSISAGLSRQSKTTSWNGRIETRLGSDRRYGINTNIIHQMNDGQIWGGSATAYRLNESDGGRVDHADTAFSIAMRKPTSRLQFLDKLEAIYDSVNSGPTPLLTAGGISATAPIAQEALMDLKNKSLGPISTTIRDAKALRFVNNFTLNWIAAGDPEESGSRTQLSFYYGAKYSIQNFDGDNYGGFTDMVSLEARHDLTSWLDIGIQAGILHSWDAGTYRYSVGPTIGISPIKNSWVSLGYNFTGFEDRDFSGSNATVKGPWISLRVKFDEQSLGLVKKDGR